VYDAASVAQPATPAAPAGTAPLSHSLPERTNSTSAPEPPWEQANPLEVFNITSPQSTMSSSGFGLDIAPLRWFDLLAGDASANDEDFSMDLLNWREAAAQMRDQPVVPNTSVCIFVHEIPVSQTVRGNVWVISVLRDRVTRDGSRRHRRPRSPHKLTTRDSIHWVRLTLPPVLANLCS